MLKFPPISLFRNVLVYVEHVNTDPEVPAEYRVTEPVTFSGTIKLHGSNCGVIWTPDGPIQAQSRETLLAPGKDYKGFAQFVEAYQKQIKRIFSEDVLPMLKGTVHKVVLYGEWVGAGVLKKNKGSAVSRLDPKHWVLFAVGALIDDDEEPRNVSFVLDGVRCSSRIGNVHRIGADWLVTIDFNDPASIEAGLAKVQGFTDAVAAVCPYGAAEGIRGAGEGIVWMPMGKFEGREDLYWKHKSEAHAVVERKERKARPAVSADLQAAIDAFVESTVTENRLDQGIDALEQQGLQVEKRNTGRFIKWVAEDVERECTLELADADLQWQQVLNAVMTKARVFFLSTAS